ncbi:MAG: Mut7-C RNAse domain-containing protein [Desulfarculus sp.]|nr:Mut7-C RNAse domain-containing protein [Desulfarculus sp.]
MIRLVAEPTLGRLVTWLRLLGLDTGLVPRLPPAAPPQTVLLTRRRALAGRPGVLFIRSDHWPEQLRQVLSELDLRPDPAARFSRCLACNELVRPLARDETVGLVPDFVRETAEGFTRCPACGKIYWPGSHGRRAEDLMAQILADLPGENSDV